MAQSFWLRSSADRPLGTQVSIAVNGVMALAVAGFLAFDYAREMRQRLADKVVALDEEALIIQQGIARLPGHARKASQEFIDDVCGRIAHADSPGHHIAVQVGDRILQSQAHDRDSAGIYDAIRAAAADPRRSGTFEGRDIVVGLRRDQGVTVFVSEQSANVRRAIRRQVLVRSTGLVLFGVLLAAAINAVVRRLVSKPLGRLMRTIDAIGAGNLGVQAGALGSLELCRLSTAINSMSQTLAEVEKRRQLAMKKAACLQEGLMPRPEALAGVGLAALHRPAEDVAGDYYDVLSMADGSHLIAVADVTGHGVPAAMTAAILKMLLQQAAERDEDPGEMLSFINSRFMTVALPEDFATMFLARWNPHTGVIRYASAGHEPALLAAYAGGVTLLSSSGLPIGVQPTSRWDTLELRGQAGDVLLICTDGVAETTNASGQMLGRSRIEEALQAHRSAPPGELVGLLDGILCEYRGAGRATDDYTLVALNLMRASGGGPGVARWLFVARPGVVHRPTATAGLGGICHEPQKSV
jgi:serine phosphatase RsbU (regulator of sigma subunit)